MTFDHQLFTIYIISILFCNKLLICNRIKTFNELIKVTILYKILHSILNVTILDHGVAVSIIELTKSASTSLIGHLCERYKRIK